MTTDTLDLREPHARGGVPRLSAQDRRIIQSACYIRAPWGLVRHITSTLSATQALVWLTLYGLAHRYPYATDSLSLRMSRVDLAQWCGVSTATLDRVLKTLTDQRLVERQHTRHPSNPFRQGWSVIYLRIPHAAMQAMAEDAFETEMSAGSAHVDTDDTSDEFPVCNAGRTDDADQADIVDVSTACDRATTERTPDATNDAPDVDICPSTDEVRRLWRHSGAAAFYLISTPDQVRAICGAIARSWQSHEVKQGSLSETLYDTLQGLDANMTSHLDLPRLAQELAAAFHQPRGYEQGPKAREEGAGHVVTPEAAASIRNRLRSCAPDEAMLERRVREAAWSISIGCFRSSGLDKGINAIRRLMRSGRWSTPYGYADSLCQPNGDGGLACTLQ